MDSMALAHNFDFYEDAQRREYQQTAQYQQEYEQRLELINQERIAFSELMAKVGKFGLIMSTTGGVVFLCRLLPVLSFGSFFVRSIAVLFLLKESIFCQDDRDRASFQVNLLAVSLGSIGAEWDSILAIGLAISDFFTLYGTSIVGSLIVLACLLLWGLFRGNNSQQPANLTPYQPNQSYTGEFENE